MTSDAASRPDRPAASQVNARTGNLSSVESGLQYRAGAAPHYASGGQLRARRPIMRPTAPGFIRPLHNLVLPRQDEEPSLSGLEGAVTRLRYSPAVAKSCSLGV